MNKLRLLYLHDYNGWAFDHVGQWWLRGLPDIEVVFKRHQDTARKELLNYHYVWFNCLSMHQRFQHDLDRSIVAIHDPSEIFPEISDWKQARLTPEALTFLKKIKWLVVISQEMLKALLQYGIQAEILPTGSTLPLRNEKSIVTTQCRALSVFSPSPRKNPKALASLKQASEIQCGVPVTFKQGHEILPERDYIQLLDQHEIYLCTSYQEGGPLPAMDAMQRGAVVLSTPVGQVQEIIEDGKNGWICQGTEDFISKIKWLHKDPNRLHQMRLTSLNMIAQKRNQRSMQAKVQSFLSRLPQPSDWAQGLWRVKQRVRR